MQRAVGNPVAGGQQRHAPRQVQRAAVRAQDGAAHGLVRTHGGAAGGGRVGQAGDEPPPVGVQRAEAEERQAQHHEEAAGEAEAHDRLDHVGVLFLFVFVFAAC